jgi:hypothetical protein
VLSDVQVTFSDGTTRDLLQKAYPIGNFIVAGFAGSVRIGFSLLQNLAQALTLPPERWQTHAWDPAYVASRWAPQARVTFAGATEMERALGSSILIVGAHPTAAPNPWGSRIVIARLASPSFEPGVMTKTIKVCSIGSGSGVAEYKNSIKPLFRITSGLLQGEVGTRGGWGQAFAYAVSHTLNSHPRTGISRHLHVFQVRRGEIWVGNNNETIYLRDDEPIEIRMPPVARGYRQFLKMARGLGAEATGAAC